MTISIKTTKEIGILREGGKRLAEILHSVAAAVHPGVSSGELNELAERLIKESGDIPSFLNYSPKGARRPFPAALCVSINDEVVHGIPNEKEKILREGDIVALDLGLNHKGFFTDGAVTVGVGKIDARAEKLIETTKKALTVGIEAAHAGATTGDIGFAIAKFVRPLGFGIVRELAGHGVGYDVHEEPFVPNFGKKGEGIVLKAGMVLAIEPMLNEGGAGIKLDPDCYTYRTKDGSRSAHFEHTIVVTPKGAEILTQM
ncbi:MAG TPA: type I methionyl aminopeptidase [Candidatus Taylorbacteria bacterium]|nr:MAG: Methionine aminopeptidase [Parcubacteria group bacterium GW2011_GWA2_47_64]KKU96377.1 MAG: Methionine aminopeptidase [Parcubacteria group bacterium GW2011_GWC2_48_17]HBV00979.1 type I methionyl aminopeptidase [Candidatus Taylorbacteria bacterium]